jgi:isopenicillin N synthase-like dioxygenase
VLRTSTVNDNTMGDLNEAFFMEREEPPDGADEERARQFRTANQWPRDLPGFRDALMTYYCIMERFTRRRLLPLYAQALELPIDYFDAAFGWPQAGLRLSHYPPVPRQANQFGIAPHTDAGFLTILPQSEVDGLHIRLPGSDWIKAPRVEGRLFINSGDMLKRWTNDRFLSTQHMAVNDSAESRYAAVFFISPDLDYERTFAWLLNDRRHSRDYERLTVNSAAMVQVSMIRLLLKRLA